VKPRRKKKKKRENRSSGGGKKNGLKSPKPPLCRSGRGGKGGGKGDGKAGPEEILRYQKTLNKQNKGDENRSRTTPEIRWPHRLPRITHSKKNAIEKPKKLSQCTYTGKLFTVKNLLADKRKPSARKQE